MDINFPMDMWSQRNGLIRLHKTGNLPLPPNAVGKFGQYHIAYSVYSTENAVRKMTAPTIVNFYVIPLKDSALE